VKGVICKVGCRFKINNFIINFKKGRLYSIVKLEDGRWWLENHEEKKRIAMDRRYVTPAILRNYFIPYQPIKRKSKYAKWRKN
jgi:hypothetical protein